MSTPAGIDVSHHQGIVLWPSVAGAGVAWAYCKATEGVSFTDRRWALNRAGARAAGVTVGAYHFARPGRSTPDKQVDHHLRLATPAPGDLVPVLDLETHDGLSRRALTRWALSWAELVAERIGTLPVIYTGPGFTRAHLEPDPALARCHLWLAHYTDRPAPAVPSPWPTWWAWQHTDRGRVSGVAGPVDRNRTRTSFLPVYRPDQETLTMQETAQILAAIADVKADVWIAADWAKRAAEAAAQGVELTQKDYEAQLIALHHSGWTPDA